MRVVHVCRSLCRPHLLILAAGVAPISLCGAVRHCRFLRMVLTLPPTQPDVIQAEPPAPLPRHALREHVLLAPSRHTRVRAPSPHLVAASRSP
jgi:hypothetical protein